MWSMNIILVGGNMYFLTFIDDFTKKAWVYLFKWKTKVFHCFKKFKAIIEKSGHVLKNLWSDGGGEYTPNDF